MSPRAARSVAPYGATSEDIANFNRSPDLSCPRAMDGWPAAGSISGARVIFCRRIFVGGRPSSWWRTETNFASSRQETKTNSLLFRSPVVFGRSVDRCVYYIQTHTPPNPHYWREKDTPSFKIDSRFLFDSAHQWDASHACRRGQPFGFLRIGRVEHHAAELVGPYLSADSREGFRGAEVVGLVVSGPAVKRGSWIRRVGSRW